jgi:hypothetical protein
MVEDNSPEHQTRAAVTTATVLLEHDFGAQQGWQITATTFAFYPARRFSMLRFRFGDFLGIPR